MEFIDAKELPLDQWLELVFNEKDANFINCCFPTDKR